MEFKYQINNDNGIVNVELEGYLDAANAVNFHEDMKKLIGKDISKIIFNAEKLEYIASAGLRVIVFTKQKIGYNADVILKSPQKSVKSVVEMSGLTNFISFEE